MFYFFIVLALLGPVVHILIKKPTDKVIIFLKYGLFSLTGLPGLYGFLGHAFVPNCASQLRAG